jgi:uncharacterized membrane protein YraQ (UPF0718 family)
MNEAMFFENLQDVTLDAAPWLLFGLFVAGLVKAWVPEEGMARMLGGKGLRPVVTGALIGMPLPICSCGVLPAAIGLRRGGASREATTSFLVSTPETGVDSIALSFGMLGPFMAVARPVAALFSAVTTGLLMAFLRPEKDKAKAPEVAGNTCCSSTRGCSAGASDEQETLTTNDGSGTGGQAWRRTIDGLGYAFGDIFNDIAGWLIVGLLLAAATMTWVPPQTLGDHGSGIVAMLVMVVVGIPMYICATASTPVAASLLLAGVSPGAAMVFMLAGPATNVATLGMVRSEMGNKAVVLYLTGIIGSSLAVGLMTDFVVAAMGVDIAVQMSGETEIVPRWLAISSAALLAALVSRIILLRFRGLPGFALGSKAEQV